MSEDVFAYTLERYNRAKELWRIEQENVRLARQREQAADVQMDKIIEDLARFEKGKGPDSASRIPWRNIRFEEGRGWWILAGTDIKDACTEFCLLAGVLGGVVEFEFNGTELEAVPDGDPYALAAAFYNSRTTEKR